MTTRFHRLLALVALLACAAQSSAAREVRIANAVVQRTAVAAASNAGNCTALLDTPLTGLGLACTGRLVTFSCDGVLTTKDVAWRMFDVAQMASVRKLPVNITVDDARKAPDNATCFASRIEVVAPAK